MNPLAEQLNQTIKATAPHVYDMLSDVGKKLLLPPMSYSLSWQTRRLPSIVQA